MRARKVTGWVVLALLTLQTACGGMLAGLHLGQTEEAQTRAGAGFNLFSPEQDIELGEASAEEIRHQLVVLQDERIEAYVQRLGERLAAKAPGYRFPYKVRRRRLAGGQRLRAAGRLCLRQRGRDQGFAQRGRAGGRARARDCACLAPTRDDAGVARVSCPNRPEHYQRAHRRLAGRYRPTGVGRRRGRAPTSSF